MGEYFFLSIERAAKRHGCGANHVHVVEEVGERWKDMTKVQSKLLGTLH